MRIKLTPVSGFTNRAIADWAKANLTPGCAVLSDGLACFAAVTEAGCQHQAIIAGGRKPKDVPEFLWVNTILGNLKTRLGGAYHAFDFAKFASRYLAASAYRFSTVASNSIRSQCVFSWPPSPSGIDQTPGFGQLKQLANQEILCKPENTELLRTAFRMMKSRHPFTIATPLCCYLSICIVFGPCPCDTDYSMRWNGIKGHLSRYYLDKYKTPPSAAQQRKRAQTVWQPRFWEHQIRDERDYEKHCDYIHWNPVIHCLVSRVCDWPHSNFHRYVHLAYIR